MQTVPVDLKSLSDVIDNEVVKNTKFNTLKAKENKIDKKIPDSSIFICIDEYKTDQQHLAKNIEDVDKQY